MAPTPALESATVVWLLAKKLKSRKVILRFYGRCTPKATNTFNRCNSMQLFASWQKGPCVRKRQTTVELHTGDFLLSWDQETNMLIDHKKDLSASVFPFLAIEPERGKCKVRTTHQPPTYKLGFAFTSLQLSIWTPLVQIDSPSHLREPNLTVSPYFTSKTLSISAISSYSIGSHRY